MLGAEVISATAPQREKASRRFKPVVPHAVKPCVRVGHGDVIEE